MGLPARSLRLLSLGCGTANRTFIPHAEIQRRNRGNWGNIQWIKYLPDLITESNMQSTWYYVEQVLGPKQYHRINARFNEASQYPILQQAQLGLDVTDPGLLMAMHQYARDIYTQEKDAIFRILGLR
jgi:hypothetical protein